MDDTTNNPVPAGDDTPVEPAPAADPMMTPAPTPEAPAEGGDATPAA
ncbi:hypothetical protein H6788_00560 [Candidatus Nomurabacteria bacterium]|nr:hypothetical protein [Candidatus Nomurabacteria bacterium]MCB9819424.1 hypothetical protein [Candidatus Nomurabacteria bacterium]